jgi:hypothetical protein
MNPKARPTRDLFRIAKLLQFRSIDRTVIDQGRLVAFAFVTYDFHFVSFFMSVSGRTSCSGQQKFSDFESDTTTGWVVYGRLVGAAQKSGLLVLVMLLQGHGSLASTRE